MAMRKDTVTVLLVGDVAASRPEPGRLFEHVAPLFRAADIAFGNQEWALSDRGAPWPGKVGRVVRCPPNGVEALTAAGFDVVSLANNHTMNYGPESLLQTIEVLDHTYGEVKSTVTESLMNHCVTKYPPMSC